MTRRAYILAAQELARPPLLFWLEDHGFDRHRDMTFIHIPEDITTAKCAAIAHAIETRVDEAVFCENDAIPSAAETNSFFEESRYDLQCVKYDTSGAHAFPRYDSFHTLIWRASGASLKKLADTATAHHKPLCWHERSPLGDKILACSCTSIARLAKLAGLTTGWIGNAGHVPKPKSPIPRIATYAK